MSTFPTEHQMTYRRLGRTGLKVSTLSFGSWVTFGDQLTIDDVMESMDAAWQGGCNFFDNAEGYAAGESERLMGEALQQLGWDRRHVVVSSKFYWGITDSPNTKNTLNRKYLHHAIEQSLERFQLDYLDLVFCHRADPNTPIEETVRAMSDMIDRGQALYWGTSEWTADEIRAAYGIAEANGWHKPVMEQPQYNMLHRDRVENEYARLYEDIGLGTTIWSPLASGLLTGKYNNGIPEDSRGSLAGYEWLRDRFTNEDELAKVAKLAPIAKRLECTQAQLALAWCAANPNVSTVITGASRPSQVTENMAAIRVVELLTPELLAEIDEILAEDLKKGK